jgi:hypothetical protein
MKLCIDCKHYRKFDGFEGYPGEYAKCAFGIVPAVSFVTGEPIPQTMGFCENMRATVGHCKPEAVNFEPKPETLNVTA